MLTNQELQALVEQVSLDYFSLPFRHQAVFNSRLKTTGGRYHLNDHHLDFNPHILEVHGETVFIGIIKHELCHYHLHLAKKGYRHKDRDFKQLLAETGGLRYAPSTVKKINHQYMCMHCGQLYHRTRKLDTSKYRCGKCRGKLREIKQS